MNRIDIPSKTKKLESLEDLKDIVDKTSNEKLVIVDCHEEWVRE